MEQVGTTSVAVDYPNHPYFGVDQGAPRFSRNDVLEVQRLKGYFGKNKGPALKKQWERAMRRDRGRAEQADSEGEASDSEVDADGISKKKKQKTKPGGRTAGGGAEMEATAALTSDTRLVDLTSVLVRNSRIGKTSAGKIAAAMGRLTTCGELAAASQAEIAAADLKLKGWRGLRELYAAVRRHLLDGGATAAAAALAAAAVAVAAAVVAEAVAVAEAA